MLVLYDARAHSNIIIYNNSYIIYIPGGPLWGLGLSPRDNLTLRVSLVCGHPLRSKVTGHGGGPSPLS